MRKFEVVGTSTCYDVRYGRHSYRRWSGGGWEELFGESWEPIYDDNIESELEQLFISYQMEIPDE